jgi:hypothetical protein
MVSSLHDIYVYLADALQRTLDAIEIRLDEQMLFPTQ